MQMINENDPATLSASGRLLAYNDAVKTGLATGERFTKLMDQLINTTVPQELAQAASELSTFVLDSEFVTFPHQYGAADYYLLFMSRMLELHNQGDEVALVSHEGSHHLTQQIVAIADSGSFAFESANDGTGGVYYTEQLTGERVFYLNLQRQMMRINSVAITNLFVVAYAATVDEAQRLAATQLLIDFGQALKTDFGYSVDFNLLDTTNSEFYAFQNAQLSSDILDKLFVAAASEDYMLMHEGNGQAAILQLPGDVVLKLTNKPSSAPEGWGLYVQDAEQNVSWLKVLLSYDFLRQWYLDNINDLQIRSDNLVF
ncbi:hypothetical protein [uncultured Secundilactobacillus sp.]|uniref:hypothetical protein n=1 Tax=uncultured Secundilactobacillus sp. TaxID=2813935 RepID=UPI0025892657|nr:hypothetical protein [uncultured Secundilactobacillus sp.]